MEVLDLSRHYKISVLADAAAAIIKEQMNATNVCIFYANAVQFNHEQLSAECAQFCEENLGRILAEDTFNMLPEVVVKQLVASDGSNAEEIAIFKALVAWGKALYGDESDSTDCTGQDVEPEPAAPETPMASPAAHPDVLAARTPTRTKKVSLRDRLAPLLEHVRFPLIDGRALAEHVEPTGADLARMACPSCSDSRSSCVPCAQHALSLSVCVCVVVRRPCVGSFAVRGIPLPCKWSCTGRLRPVCAKKGHERHRKAGSAWYH